MFHTSCRHCKHNNCSIHLEHSLLPLLSYLAKPLMWETEKERQKLFTLGTLGRKEIKIRDIALGALYPVCLDRNPVNILPLSPG